MYFHFNKIKWQFKQLPVFTKFLIFFIFFFYIEFFLNKLQFWNTSCNFFWRYKTLVVFLKNKHCFNKKKKTAQISTADYEHITTVTLTRCIVRRNKGKKWYFIARGCPMVLCLETLHRPGFWGAYCVQTRQSQIWRQALSILPRVQIHDAVFNWNYEF